MISKINALRTRATLTKRVHLNEVNPRFLAEYRQVLPQCFLVIAASFVPKRERLLTAENVVEQAKHVKLASWPELTSFKTTVSVLK